MITRSIDSSYDWSFGKGKQDYLSDSNALIQNINTRLMSFVGDCYFDQNAGIDWFLYLGSKNINGLKLSVGSVISSTDGVQDVTELNFTLDSKRQLLIQYAVTSSWSTALSGTITL